MHRKRKLNIAFVGMTIALAAAFQLLVVLVPIRLTFSKLSKLNFDSRLNVNFCVSHNIWFDEYRIWSTSDPHAALYDQPPASANIPWVATPSKDGRVNGSCVTVYGFPLRWARSVHRPASYNEQGTLIEGFSVGHQVHDLRMYQTRAVALPRPVSLFAFAMNILIVSVACWASSQVVIWGVNVITDRRRRSRGLCVTCGYPYGEGVSICPECGSGWSSTR